MVSELGHWTRPKFETTDTGERYHFLWGSADDPYLTRLRTRYKLGHLVSGSGSDFVSAFRICDWAHSLWDHDGDAEPVSSDPLSILREVECGKAFRCAEYATVAQAALQSIGIPSRLLGLKRKDVETRESEAGHVAVESYLPSIQRWILVDAQFHAVPVVNGIPANAVEILTALVDNPSSVSVLGLSGTDGREYLTFMLPYLYYFDVGFDNRIGRSGASARRLMLVPIGARRPKVMQRKWSMGDVVYTHSLRAFYPRPSPDGNYPA